MERKWWTLSAVRTGVLMLRAVATSDVGIAA
jgi:hypothetical protein